MLSLDKIPKKELWYYTFDKTLKIGDVVFGYRKGLWKIIKIIDNSNEFYNNSNIPRNNLFDLEMICRENGIAPKTKIRDVNVDGRYVKRPQELILREIERLNNLLKIVKEYSNYSG